MSVWDPPAQVIVKDRRPGVKGPATVTVLPETVATPALTLTSAGGLSKVTVIDAFAAIPQPDGGFALTKLAGTGSSVSSSPPHPVSIKTASKPASNNPKFLNNSEFMQIEGKKCILLKNHHLNTSSDNKLIAQRAALANVEVCLAFGSWLGMVSVIY